MKRLEIKARLERALRTRISAAEWLYLQRAEVVSDFEQGGYWEDCRDRAEYQLDWVRRFYEDKKREESGDLEDAALEDAVPEHDTVYPAEGMPADPLDSFAARMFALGALSSLHARGAPPRSAMHSTLLPRGGVDGTLPQWLFVTAVEMWVPAGEVAKEYRRIQQTMMADPNPPRTQARAFNVARFVWEQEKIHGKRPPWPTMCERWNDFPLTKPFESWRNFRTYFERGARAVPPRYVASNEQLTKLVRTEGQSHARVFRSWTEKVLAATVQQPG